MQILSKIGYIVVFCILMCLSVFSSDINNKEKEMDKNITPSSVALRVSPPESSIEEKKMQIPEENYTVHTDQRTFSPSIETTIELASEESQAPEIPESLPLTIRFHSSHTNTIYQIDDFIGKPIGEYIKILVKNCTLEIEDRRRYNYDFSISCNPELPENILTGLGISALTRKTVIAESLSQQLSFHSCTLSFSFKEQTVLSTKCEQEKRVHCVPSQYSLIRKQEGLARESLINCFLRNAKNPSSATSQSALHLGYTLVKIKDKAVIVPKGSPDALLHGTKN